LLPPTDQADGLFTAVATHFYVRLKGPAHRRPFGPAKQRTQVFDREMNATFSGRLAIGHTGHRRTDGGGNAASATTFTAFHGEKLLATGKGLNDAQ
jgi:hypothetical protein